MTRKTIFISDIHLDENHPQLINQFLTWLNNLDASVDALYILGDLFELWIGDDDRTIQHQNIKQALKNIIIQKKIPVYFMHGNRDFLIGKNFLKETGCIGLPDPTILLLYGTPVLLMHGDLLCTEDHAYIKARKVLHNRLLQNLFLFLPLSLRKKIAHQIRARSKQYTQSTSPTIMNVSKQMVNQVMLQHQVLHLIHGHTHRKKIHTFHLNQQNAMRIVLGSWHDGANALYFHDSHQFEIVTVKTII